ncbi:MAG: thiamine-monophosphate kinase [Proteobacteria bacterium]|nr:thiamine-monophosphate kinase [Pseudomonadota bacterium]MBU1689066.1 thiamine-monophosphate kinase [Pseudomonadota bacterium]
MNREVELIKKITAIMPTEHQRGNRAFECDAEIIKVSDKELLFTIDEFSAEDLFRDHDPYSLGWNCAVGAISDILAAGGVPTWYGHSMTVAHDWSSNYIEQFAQGVADVLVRAGVGFMGGDFGSTETWRYTASVIGIPEGRPLLRRGASIGDIIYLSGRIGLGNLEAALNLFSKRREVVAKITAKIKTRLPLRLLEANLLRQYATSCIDTSDGMRVSLDCMAEINNSGYLIETPPYLKSGLWAAKLLSLPAPLLFLGEAGEYELLFTIKEEDEDRFLLAAEQQGLCFYRLGMVAKADTRLLRQGNHEFDLKGLNIRGRDFVDAEGYLQALKDWLEKS